MVMLGCKPHGRYTEQHDIFFGIGRELKDLAEEMYAFWPEAQRKLHIDAWRSVTHVDGYTISITKRQDKPSDTLTNAKLFFINLGGYKRNEFEEYHYKMLCACADKGEAIQRSKQTIFYKHTGFAGAVSHVDDKYGVDVDDMYEIADILSSTYKQQYSIVLTPADNAIEDELHPGYIMLEKL